jgi:hypothetical protein
MSLTFLMGAHEFVCSKFEGKHREKWVSFGADWERIAVAQGRTKETIVLRRCADGVCVLSSQGISF